MLRFKPSMFQVITLMEMNEVSSSTVEEVSLSVTIVASTGVVDLSELGSLKMVKCWFHH